MKGQMAGISATALLALLLLSIPTAQAAPPPVSEVSIDGDVDLNNRVRYAFQTVPDSAKYDIYYSDESFNNLTEMAMTRTYLHIFKYLEGFFVVRKLVGSSLLSHG